MAFKRSVTAVGGIAALVGRAFMRFGSSEEFADTWPLVKVPGAGWG
jgi:hypothetical protein